MSEIGKQDERALTWIAERLDAATDENEVQTYSDMLLYADKVWGAAHIEEGIKQKKYAKNLLPALKRTLQYYQPK